MRNQGIKISAFFQIALSTPSIKSKLVLQCLGQLNELANDNNVQLVRVPGHSNIQGNKKADQLARHGASQSFIGPEPVFGVPLSSVKEALKNEWLVIAIRDHWNRIPGHSYQ